MLLKNCIIIEDGEKVKADILIAEGKIAKIDSSIDSGCDCNKIDLEGKIVIPGMIDPHVHFRDPGMTHKEDWYTGSRAAAAGGITTVLDMPNTIPPMTTIKLLDEKRAIASKSLVNFGFHFGAGSNNIEEIKRAGYNNIASVKIFFNVSTGNLLIEDDDALDRIFENSSFVTVHAEDDKVKKSVLLSKEFGTRLYLCHISLKSEIDYIRENKDKNIFVEVTPHHLFLDNTDDKDGFTKMMPSLKSPEDRKSLWDAINEGLVDTIGTDHAPHTVEEKKSDKPPFGVPGCETVLPLLLDAVNKKKITLSKVIELCCTNPAKIFGIKNKGILREGYDADITVIDMDLVKEVKNKDLQTKCKWSPFAGRKLKGWPIMTIVNGNIVYHNGEIIDMYKAREVEYDERKDS